MAHPVVVVSLLQRSTEVEAATGHTCISGTLDVPVEGASAAIAATQHSVLIPTPPHPTPPQGSSTWPYLGHLDWCCQSQLASPASVLPGMSSHNAAMTPACPMGPRTGHSQSGESHPKNSAPREGTAPLTLFMWTYPAGNRCSWTKVDLPAVGKCGHQLESRNQMIAGGAGDWSGCGISPPGNPTVTTTSGLGLRRMLDSGM